MSDGFLIGPGLRDKLRVTIARVDAMPYKESATQIPTRFEDVQRPAMKTFRICTFTGTWSIDTDRVVTFRGVTTTPNTVLATNLFSDVGGGGSETSNPCAIARDGTAWYLIAARCTVTCTTS